MADIKLNVSLERTNNAKRFYTITDVAPKGLEKNEGFFYDGAFYFGSSIVPAPNNPCELYKVDLSGNKTNATFPNLTDLPCHYHLYGDKMIFVAREVANSGIVYIGCYDFSTNTLTKLLFPRGNITTIPNAFSVCPASTNSFVILTFGSWGVTYGYKLEIDWSGAIPSIVGTATQTDAVNSFVNFLENDSLRFLGCGSPAYGNYYMVSSAMLPVTGSINVMNSTDIPSAPTGFGVWAGNYVYIFGDGGYTYSLVNSGTYTKITTSNLTTGTTQQMPVATLFDGFYACDATGKLYYLNPTTGVEVLLHQYSSANNMYLYSIISPDRKAVLFLSGQSIISAHHQLFVFGGNSIQLVGKNGAIIDIIDLD